MPVVRRAHPAMHTRFEAILAGEDAEHLEAVGTLVFEEVDRVEQLLSLFDPASEIARINRNACGQPLKISVELADVLQQCRDWFYRTESTFDIVMARGRAQRLGWQDIELDPVARTVAIHNPEVAFDFGGFGKGYALDRASAVLRQYGIQDAFLHAGTSSALAIGIDREHNRPWHATVGLGTTRHVLKLPDLALSTSATVDEHNTPCEVVDPRSGELVAGRKSCFVVAETAAIAEILSTAMLILGPLGSRLRESWYDDGDRRLRRVGWYEGAPGYERYTEGGYRQR